MKRTVIVIASVLIAGLMNLAYPFKGDQALFMVGAKTLAEGGVLYRDFWDLKQPGIYWFYHAAGMFFGYSEIGVHLAELLWFGALAIVVSVSMKRRFVLPWMSDVCAVLTVGVYFAVCGTWHLTQLEGLVSLPLFLCLLLIMPRERTPRVPILNLLMFGSLLAVVALFKLMLVAIPITFILVAAIPNIKVAIRNALWISIGSAIVIAPAIFYFAAEHQLALIYKTFFIYPPRILAEVPMNGFKVLLHGSRWFVLSAGPLLPLGLVGLICRLRTPVDRFSVAIVAWIIVAAVLVLVQHMWWEYHFLLVLFPLGLLATMGLEQTILWLRSRPHHAGLSATLLLVALCPFALRSIHKAVDEIRHRPLVAFRLRVSPDYANATTEAQWVNADPQRSGTLYILGDPLIQFLSDRKQIVALNGWSPEWFLPEQWSELAQEIDTAQPQLVFVAADNQAIIQERGDPVKRLLTENYLPSHVDSIGVWYSRVSPSSNGDQENRSAASPPSTRSAPAPKQSRR